MELHQFISKFADCFAATPASEIHAGTEFKSLEEWGSMMALIVIAMTDSEYGKTLNAEDLRKAKTVEELFNMIAAK